MRNIPAWPMVALAGVFFGMAIWSSMVQNQIVPAVTGVSRDAIATETAAGRDLDLTSTHDAIATNSPHEGMAPWERVAYGVEFESGIDEELNASVESPSTTMHSENFLFVCNDADECELACHITVGYTGLWYLESRARLSLEDHTVIAYGAMIRKGLSATNYELSKPDLVQNEPSGVLKFMVYRDRDGTLFIRTSAQHSLPKALLSFPDHTPMHQPDTIELELPWSDFVKQGDWSNRDLSEELRDPYILLGRYLTWILNIRSFVICGGDAKDTIDR